LDNPLLTLLHLIKPGSTTVEIHAACRRVIDHSDMANCGVISSTGGPRDVLAESIFRYIALADRMEVPKISLGPLYYEFDSMDVGDLAVSYSIDFLSQYCLPSWERWQDPEVRVDRLLEYLVAILYRFTWCSNSDSAFFPFSEVIDFVKLCTESSRRANRPAEDRAELCYLVLQVLEGAEFVRHYGEVRPIVRWLTS
jgi:hypothetical protein